jgi:cytochrome c oxidase assembly protein subunit 17
MENSKVKKVEKEIPKPCCACPETRKNRDLCIFEKGEENCADIIELHRKCMKEYGYII